MKFGVKSNIRRDKTLDWEAFWNNIVDFFSTNGMNIIYVVLLLIFGYLLVRLVYFVSKKILSKTKMDRITQSFFTSVIKTILYVLLLIIILQVAGVPITGLIAILSAAGLAIALALKDSLSNIANGLIIISTKPFHSGDYISVGDTEGKVISINILTTRLQTVDNKIIILPNSTVLNGNITNYSTQSTRRLTFTFSIDYRNNIDRAKEIIMNVITSNGKVLLEPSPTVHLDKLNQSSVDLVAKCWCANKEYWNMYYYIMDNVFNELKRNQINIPYNQLDVHLVENEGQPYIRREPLPERVEEPKITTQTTPTLFGFQLCLPHRKKSSKKKSKRKQKLTANAFRNKKSS